MKYLPNWKCWAASFILLLSSIIPALAIRFTGKMTVDVFMSSVNSGTTLTIPILWILFIGLILPIFLSAHIWEFLWGDPDPESPKWLPAPRSWAEGFWGWTVLILSSTLTFDILNLFYDAPQLFRPEVSEIDGQIFAVWWLVSSYFYHFRMMVTKVKPKI